MEIKEYYYLVGKDRNGPLTTEELKTKEITAETFVWTEGMENWQKIKDIPELFVNLKSKSPPPLPIEEIENYSKITESNTDTTPEIKPDSTNFFVMLILWCALHLFALIVSYSQIGIFNNQGKPQSKEFWPFVKFSHPYYNDPWHVKFNEEPSSYFHGIFVEYDLSEFSVYVGGALLCFLLFKLNEKNKKHPIT